MRVNAMSTRRSKPPRIVAILAQSSLLILAAPATAQLGLGVEEIVRAGGVPIDLPGSPRSRPSISDWTGDGSPDVLIGAGDGTVRLYQGVSAIPGVSRYGLIAMGLLLLTCGAVLTRRRTAAA
jgi:hypothetical protein